MDWLLRNTTNKQTLPLVFESADAAKQHLTAMGAAFSSVYTPVPDTTNPWVYRTITEGLVAGDLRNIILPQISIDEYVPANTGTDNIVIAVFINGVPEAVIPVRDFLFKTKGVVDVAYGDSDLLANTSIMYAEFVRPTFKYEYLHTMMTGLSLLSNIDIDDFSTVFPTSTKKYPYDKDTITNYFKTRDEKTNMDAQKKAMQTINDDDANADDANAEHPITPDEANEALIEFITNAMA